MKENEVRKGKYEEEQEKRTRKLNFLKKMQRKISFKMDTKFALIPC